MPLLHAPTTLANRAGAWARAGARDPRRTLGAKLAGGGPSRRAISPHGAQFFTCPSPAGILHAIGKILIRDEWCARTVPMIFRELNRGNCKTYLLACERSREAVIVDPLKEHVDRYLAVLGYHRLTLAFVVDTHTHADHRTGLWDLRDLAGAPAVMHRRAPAPHIDRHGEDGERLSAGDVELIVLHTPGHTPDGICLVAGERVLTGDTLLIHGTGRADFAGGDAGAQYDSIVE